MSKSMAGDKGNDLENSKWISSAQIESLVGRRWEREV